MVAVPAPVPVIRPPPDGIVATEILLVVQTPPGVASVSATPYPVHTGAIPTIGEIGLTVIVVVLKQPVPNV